MKFTEERIQQYKDWLAGNRPKLPDGMPDHIELKAGKLWAGKYEIVPWESRNAVVKLMYEDPRQTGGRDRLYEHIAEKYLGISRRCVAAFLQNNVTHQVHQPLPRRRVTRPIIISAPNSVAQIHLIDMQSLSGWNHAKRYILTWVDLFTKFANARALPTKRQRLFKPRLMKFSIQTLSLLFRAIMVPSSAKAPRHSLKAKESK
jgi:hypothetical protein